MDHYEYASMNTERPGHCSLEQPPSKQDKYVEKESMQPRKFTTFIGSALILMACMVLTIQVTHEFQEHREQRLLQIDNNGMVTREEGHTYFYAGVGEANPLDSPSPTSSPVIDTIFACPGVEDKNGHVSIGSKMMHLTFSYTIETQGKDRDPQLVAEKLEHRLNRKLAHDLLDCKDMKGRELVDWIAERKATLPSENSTFTGGRTHVIAIDSKPIDRVSLLSTCKTALDNADKCTVVHATMKVYMTSEADLNMVKYFFRSTIMTYLKTNAFVGNVNHLLHATYRGPAFSNPSKNGIASQGSNGERANANTKKIFGLEVDWGLSHRVSMIALIAVPIFFGITVILTFWWCRRQREKLTDRDASSTSELREDHNKDSRHDQVSVESTMASTQMQSDSLSVILEEDGEYEDDSTVGSLSTVGSRSTANTRRSFISVKALSQKLDSLREMY
eukprot:scaffold60496_cov59-Attheya_sp.AAC.5